MLIHCTVDSPLGRMILARNGQGLCGVWFEGQRHAPTELPEHTLHPDDPLLQKAGQQLAEYFSERRQQFDLPLDLTSGTAFQQAVWQALLKLPHGQLGRYGQIAQQLGRPNASRAVGAAVGRNPISIIVPCHRVVGQSGQLTGYAGGLWRKQALLQMEGRTGLF
jgi:methylated-DNA-[protein]-cysteine S-methyltransferase